MIERRYAHGKQERLPELASELVRLKVDVIVTGANPVIAAVQKATKTIPVVMTTSRDPVGAGFIASFSRPGGNITGLCSDPTPELQSKRLELLKQALPKAVRLGMLWNPLPPAAGTYLDVAQNAAAKLGFKSQPLAARTREEFAGAFAAMASGGADAVFVLPDPMFFTAREQVLQLVGKHRLPSLFHASEFVESGGLMSYGSNLADHFRRAATFVDKILKGAKPADLPVELATKLELVINLKTAKTLGLVLPRMLLLRADRVIE